jgi:O-antigen/teichoic acid export membrane protein
MVTGKVGSAPDQETVSTSLLVRSDSGIRRLASRWGLPFHSLLYFVAIAVACVLIFGQNLYAAKSLGPALYGIWNIFAITYTYGLLAHLGVLNGLAREYPRALADSAPSEAQQLAQSAFWINALSTLLFSTIALLILRAAFVHTPQVSWHMLLLFVIFLLLQGWTNFLMFLFRARDQFKLLSVFTLTLNAGVLVGAFFFIPRWSLEGFVLAWAVTYLVVSVFFLRNSQRHLFALPDWGFAWYLLRVGAPILLFTLTATINWTMDRLLIARFLGVVAVGYFAVAAFAVRLLNYVPEMVSQVMYPRWAATKLSRSGEDSNLSWGPFRMMFWLMPLLGGLAYYACYLIPLFLPTYKETVLPSQVLCLAASLTSIGLFCGAYLGAIGRERLALRAQVAIVVLRAIIVGGALLLGGTLLHAAYASAASSAAFGVVLLWLTGRQFAGAWQFLFNGLCPWGLCTAWLAVIELLRHKISAGNPAELTGLTVGATIFLLGAVAFLARRRRPIHSVLHVFPAQRLSSPTHQEGAAD